MLDSARNAQNSVQPGSVRVLTYHRFGNTSYDPFCVSPVDFETQMAFLAQHKRALSLLRFEQFLSGSIELPNDSVLVTIDDGHLSTWSTAMPILRRHSIPAVAFVTPNMVGRQTAGNVRIAEGYAGWPELRELLRCGIEVASHSMSHKSFGSMSATEVREEAVRSKSVLEDRLGIEVTTFAYPYGTRADFNSSTAKILRDVGYRLAFTSQHGAIRRGANPWELPRIKIEGSEPIWMFRLATRGGLDRWKWIDRGLWRLQASPGGRR
jgi:peptidoglycan/xylan/chitin deacetylase (PgdA/CDA1 family)